MTNIGKASENRLAGILEGYLKEEKWATEKRLEGEVYKSHNPEELQRILESERFSYIRKINPTRLEQIKKKFLSV